MILGGLVYLLLANALAWALFAADKAAAQERRRRIPEATLLLAALAGGSLGAVCAQRLLRHKTVKQPFAAWLGLIIVAQIGVVLVAGYFGLRSPSQ